MAATIDEWIAGNEGSFGSDFERLFARRVLPLVENLDLRCIAVQYSFVDLDGRQRYCDFALEESAHVKVAIEIDGYDKRGEGTGMSHDDFVDWQRRQASLTALGWYVLRFANRDVRDHPEKCAQYVNRLLRRLRDEAQPSDDARREALAVLPCSDPTGTLEARQTIDLRPIDSNRSVDIPKDRRGWTAKRLKLMATAILCFIAVISLWSAANKLGEEPPASVVQDGKTTLLTAPGSTQTNAMVRPELRIYGSLNCVNPLRWTDAREHVGETVTVVGPYVATAAKRDFAGSPLWMDIGEPYPSKNRVSIVIWGANWTKFDLRALDLRGLIDLSYDFGYPHICVQGRIGVYKGAVQIEIDNPRQLLVTGDGWPP